MGINDGFTVLDNGAAPPTVNVAGGPVAFNPFGSVVATRTTPVGTIIQAARARHWSFSDTKLPDGAVLMNLRQYERDLLAMCAEQVEGFVGTTIQYGVSKEALAGHLVKKFNGVIVLAEIGEDGWPVQFDDDGFPFVDTSAPMLAGDPLQQWNSGGLQGFPLPAQFIRVINATLVWENGFYQRFNIVPERDRLAALTGRDPVAFVSNNRFIPMLYTPTLETVPNSWYYSFNSERWGCLKSVQVSYIAMTSPKTLDDLMALPDVLANALITKVSSMMAVQSQFCSPADKRLFMEQEQQAMADISVISNSMMGPPAKTDVEYYG